MDCGYRSHTKPVARGRVTDLRELRDPIHGFIYPEIVPEIIDTPTFQRLRSIRQLALASLVYPGARHSRFEHSLGVMHLAGRIGRRFRLAQEDLRALCLAALLHDVGHGPFSHVSEDIVDRFYDKNKVVLERGQKVHEIITQGLIKTDEGLRKYMSDHDVDRVNSILGGTGGSRLLSDIISGPLDCDKQDYLLRDSYYCGVKYGIYDIDRLIDVLEAAESDGDRILAVSKDGIHTLEQFVLAKYYMTTQVYKHKVRLVTDAMIIRAIELGIEKDQLSFLEELYRYDGSEGFLCNWIKWDDEALAAAIYSDANRGYAYRIFNALRQRRLHKQIYSQKIASEVFKPHTRMALSENFTTVAKRIEAEVGRLIGFEDPNLIIASKFTIKSVREQSRNEREAPIMVAGFSGLTPFEEESMLFRSIAASEEEEYVEVYAPLPPGFSDEAQKKKLRAKWAVEITEIVEQIVEDYLSNEGGTRDDGFGGFSYNIKPCGGNDKGQDPGP